jgi:glycosyltransferase involved in cell wall biosynthesis
MPTVSVIIPVYNRRSLLERAVASVLGQRFRDFECIVVDDGSDDGCETLVCLGEPPVRCIRLPRNRGVSAARNAGVRAAGAPWIAFLDSDDEWLPEKLSHRVAWARRNPEYRILQTREAWIRNGVRVNAPATHEKSGGDLFAASLERCMITPSSVMMRADLFNEAGGFDESLPACEDYDLWLRITAHHPVGLVDEVLLRRYGGHGDQLSATVPMLDRFRIESLRRLLEKGALHAVQADMVRAQIRRRAEICANGCLKRGNGERHEYYRTIVRQY